MKISKITLGTAQLGSNYGIANTTGKPNFNTICEILKIAINSGITTFDTSPSYGDSEKILGDFLKTTSSTLNIITKIPKIKHLNTYSFQEIYDLVKQSVIFSAAKLNLEKIPICLLHDPSDMTNYNGLVTKSLVALKDEGLINRIGVSVYTPQEVEKFLDLNDFDAIQIPINIFDTRLIKNNLLNQLTKQGIIIFARSIFLQGLFFLDSNKLPFYLNKVKDPLSQLHKLSSELEMNVNELALKFVNEFSNISSMVIGVDSSNQLKTNIDALDSPPLPNEIIEKIIDIFDDIPEELINPSMWNKDIDK